MTRLLLCGAVCLLLTTSLAIASENPILSPEVSAAALTAVAGFIGSWVGAKLALTSFKRQRAFDKQLDWYERANKSLQEMAEKIDIALTFEDEKGTSPANRKRNWSTVQGAQLEIDRVESQAALFASSVATEQISSAAEFVQEIGDKTAAFDPPCIKEAKKKHEALELIADVPDKLRETQKVLIIEARRHLSFDSRGFLIDNLVETWKRLRMAIKIR